MAVKVASTSTLHEVLRLNEYYGWSIFPVPPGTRASYYSQKDNTRKWGMSNDPETLESYFTNFPMAGVGIPTGTVNGIWVVDYESVLGHGVDGVAVRDELQKQHGPLPPTLQVETATGGLHDYWLLPKGVTIKKSTGKLAPGVDVIAQNSMVIAPPTYRPGKGTYRWLNNNPIVPAPDWLVQLAIDAASNGADRIGDHDHEDHADPTADLRFVEAAMAVIPNNEYVGVPDAENFEFGWDDWNRIGMAVYRATNGVDAGFEIWDAWSQKNEAGYNAKDTRKRWESFKHSPPDQVSFGSIKWLANKADPDWEVRLEKEMIEKMRQADLNWKKKHGREIPEPEPEPAEQAEPQAEEETEEDNRLLRSSEEFAAGFVPPDYLIKDLLQRRFIYSLTGMTGSGKTSIVLRLAAHVALGLPLGGKQVERGRVLVFAGENPDDMRMRWVKLCEKLKQNIEDMDVYFLAGAMPLGEVAKSKNMAKLGIRIRAQIEDELETIGPISLLIIDTNSAYFMGDDENDNVQAGNHARMLRSYVELKGGPTILVTCHPTKNAGMDNLLPRGGGAFLNEVDGNLVAIRETGTPMVEINTHGKFRGPEFAPIPFRIEAGKTEKLKDTKGNPIWTVTVEPVSSNEQEANEETRAQRQMRLMRVMEAHPGSSITELAVLLGYTFQTGEPDRSMVQRLLRRLSNNNNRLVEKGLDERYRLTRRGIDRLRELNNRAI